MTRLRAEKKLAKEKRREKDRLNSVDNKDQVAINPFSSHPSIQVSIYPSIYSSIYLSNCPFMYLTIYLSILLSVLL